MIPLAVVLILGCLAVQAVGEACPCYGLVSFPHLEEEVILHVQFSSVRAFRKACTDICLKEFCLPLNFTDSASCNPLLAERVPLGDWVALEWFAEDECEDDYSDPGKLSRVGASANSRRGATRTLVNQLIEMLEEEIESRVTTTNLSPCGTDETGRVLFIAGLVISLCLSVFFLGVFIKLCHRLCCHQCCCSKKS